MKAFQVFLRRDNSKTQQSQKVIELHRQHMIKDEFSEPHNQQQNPVESQGIRWLKMHIDTVLNRSGAPDYLWLEAAKWLCGIHRYTADETLNWGIPHTIRHGDTADISAYLIFQFFEKVLYLDIESSFPSSTELPGYFVGVEENVGDKLTFRVLTEDTRQVISRSVVRPAKGENHANKRVTFARDFPVEDEDSDDSDDEDEGPPPLLFRGEPFEDVQSAPKGKKTVKRKKSRRNKRRNTPFSNPGPADSFPPSMDPPDPPEAPPSTPTHPPNPKPVSETTASPSKPVSQLRGDMKEPRRSPRLAAKANKVSALRAAAWFMMATFGGLTMTQDSTTDVSVLKTHETRVPVMDNVISPNDVDIEVKGMKSSAFSKKELQQLFYMQHMDSFQDALDPHECPVAVTGHQLRRYDPQDIHYRLDVQWLNGEKTSVRADAMKLQHPDMVANYAVTKKLTEKPAFDWVADYLESHVDIKAKIVNMNARAVKKFKFGVEVPRSSKHAFALDKLNGDTLWKAAFDKELAEINMHKTFREARPDDDLSDYKRLPYHVIFDCKFDGRRKARLVVNGSKSDPPKEDIYSGVVNTDNVRLAFQIAAMNGLDVCAADVSTAFLYGKSREKVYIIAGPEFGELQGKTLIVDKGIYGLRSSAARFHEHISEKIRKMGFHPSKADADLYIREADGHYEMLACYVDDLIAFGKKPDKIIEEFKKIYMLKGVGQPEYYLGGDVQVLNEHWQKQGVSTGLSAQTYIKNSVEKVEKMLKTNLKSEQTPMIESDHPELDESELCTPLQHSHFRALVGSANWCITLGRFDIAFAIQSLARFNMAPRVGHLKRMMRVFGYLKTHPNGALIIDPASPDHGKFEPTQGQTWSEFYPDAEEEVPPGMPKPLGRSAKITCYVDADHAHDQLTRRSVTGILLFVNNTPLRWVSKRQKTVETSTYGSELVAARIATDLIIEMRYNLRALGVPLDGPALLLGDNQSVVLNTTVPSSVLKKKHNAVAYHRVRESIAAGILVFAHINSEDNYADLATKSLGKATFHRLARKVLFRQPDATGCEERTTPVI